MEKIIHLMEIKELVDTTAKNGTQFRSNFMRDYREKFGRFPQVVDVFEREGGFGCVISERDVDYKSMVSVFEEKPLVLMGYPDPKDISDLMFDCKHHVIPGLEGEVVSIAILPNGELVEMNKDSQIFDSSKIDSFMTVSRLKKVCNEYNCVIHGISHEGRFTALDIADMGNQSYYNKAMSDQIFEQSGLSYLKDICGSQQTSALQEHGKLWVKVYRAGELQLFQKAVAMQNQMSPNHKQEIKELLDKHYKMASSMAPNQTYNAVSGWNLYPQYSRELVVQSIEEWKKGLRHRSAEELFTLDKNSL
ncbi:hypothetical protein [Paenibacillus illinoisensis]|uniref:hypothetical protein n=1 Tax=Paenibacillus illinoisensis TaxID=59845 RepID=UPI0030167781